METITSQQISLIIQQTGTIISAFWPIVLLLGGIKLAFYVLEKVRGMFNGSNDLEFYDEESGGLVMLSQSDKEEFDERLKEEESWERYEPLSKGYRRLLREKYGDNY